MAKRKLYIYNPDTDNFERLYPTLTQRLIHMMRFGGAALVCGVGIYLIITYCLSVPTERNLREENDRLKAQYGVLQRRLDAAIQVMGDISARDDNFYRVMMQMEPMSDGQRFAGLDNDSRYKELRSLGDASVAMRLSRGMDLLERQIYSQSLSFDELRSAAGEQQEKLAHIPGVIPINIKDYTLASGYGYRRDPIYGATRFHEGLDFAAPTGTPVFATADGTVEVAERLGNYGNCIDVNHGFNYLTRYAHLSQIMVSPGQIVKRGEMIGRVGSTGKSTGSHLHYEVRYRGEPQNPVNYYYLDLSPQEYEEMIELAENSGHVMD